MEMIAFQFDLGRQKESISFLKQMADFVKSYGYNTIVLYLENCVRTDKTSFFRKEESYSMDEMKEIVSYMEGIGLDVIPAFETLGHIEKFLDYEELSSFSEVEDCSKEGRGWWQARYKRGQNGCVSNDELFNFMSEYVKDVSSLFSSKYIHMGLDEIFDFAICKKCKERLNSGLTKVDLFKEYIIKCHSLVKGLNKRMMMWDDFFEYFDCVYDLPRDIIMCTWNYYHITDELPGKWTNRTRRDNFRIYNELGFDYIMCTYAHNAGSTYNIDSFYEYSSKFKPMGALMTTWERSALFYQGLLPSIAYGGMLWNSKIKSEEDRLNLYSNLLGGYTELAELILSIQIPIFMGAYLDIRKVAESDYFFKTQMRSQYKYALKKIKPYIEKLEGLSKDILIDIYDYILDNYQILKIAYLGTKLFDMYEGKEFDDSINKGLDEVIENYKEIKMNGDYLFNKYRNGIKSTDNAYENQSTGNINFAISLKNELIQNRNVGIFYMDAMMHDAYSTVKGEIRVKYEGDDKETIIYSGAIKPSSACIELGASYDLRIRMENRKIEYAIFDSFGEGAFWPLHFKYLENGVKHHVTKVEALYGNVKDVENILKSNSEFITMGYSSGYEHLVDENLSKKRNGIKLYF